MKFKFNRKKNNQDNSPILIPSQKEISEITEEREDYDLQREKQQGPQFTGMFTESGEAIYRCTEPMDTDTFVEGNDPRYSTISFAPSRKPFEVSKGGIILHQGAVLTPRENIIAYEGEDKEEDLEQITQSTFSQAHPTLAKVGQFAKAAAPYVGAASVAGLVLFGFPATGLSDDDIPSFGEATGYDPSQPKPTQTTQPQETKTKISLSNGLIDRFQPNFLNIYAENSELFRFVGGEARLLGYFSDLGRMFGSLGNTPGPKNNNGVSDNLIYSIGVGLDHGDMFKKDEATRWSDFNLNIDSAYKLEHAAFGHIGIFAALNKSPKRKGQDLPNILTAIGLSGAYTHLKFKDSELVSRDVVLLGLDFIGLYGPLQIQSRVRALFEDDKRIFGIHTDSKNGGDIGFNYDLRASLDTGKLFELPLLGDVHGMFMGHFTYNYIPKRITGVDRGVPFVQNELRRDLDTGITGMLTSRHAYLGAFANKYWEDIHSRSEQAPWLNQNPHHEHYSYGLTMGLHLPTVLGENTWLGFDLFMDHEQNSKKWPTRDNYGGRLKLTINF